MTEQQLYFFCALALAISIAAALLTRATLRRIAGAMAGAGAGWRSFTGCRHSR